jgi:hypothetical protein
LQFGGRFERERRQVGFAQQLVDGQGRGHCGFPVWAADPL